MWARNLSAGSRDVGGQGGNRTPTAEGGWSTASGAHHLLNLPTGTGDGSSDCGLVVNPSPLICTWSRRRDSNPEPAVYKTAALPIELRRRGAGPYRRWTLRRRGMIRSAARPGQARHEGRTGSPATLAGRSSAIGRTAREEIVGGRIRLGSNRGRRRARGVRPFPRGGRGPRSCGGRDGVGERGLPGDVGK